MTNGKAHTINFQNLAYRYSDISCMPQITSYRNDRISSSMTKEPKAYIIATILQNSNINAQNSPKRIRAKRTLIELANLKDNWDNNGAVSIAVETMKNAFRLIEMLPVVPDIFPTTYGNLQFEYEKENGEYLEMELQPDNVKVFTIECDGSENTELVSYRDQEKLKLMTRKFL